MLCFLSQSTKLRKCGASSTSPSTTTAEISFPSASMSFTSGVWHTSELSTVPGGMMLAGGMIQRSGALAPATPQ
jgi:hypothetical protein